MPLKAEHVALAERNGRTLIFVYLDGPPTRQKATWYTELMFFYHPLGRTVDPALERLLQLLYRYRSLLTGVRLTAADNKVRLQLSKRFLPGCTPMQKLVTITGLLQDWLPPLQTSNQAATEYTEVDGPSELTWEEHLRLASEFMFLETLNAHLAEPR